MGMLTEAEIFDCMDANIKLAVQCCRDLATNPIQGPTYDRLRRALGLVEGTCRQASAWREDTRWLQIGLSIAAAHKMSGDWLRGYKIDGMTVKLAASQINKVFTMLATNLEGISKLAQQTKNGRTGRLGMILPDVLPAPMRTSGRPMQVLLPPSMRQRGLVLPPKPTASLLLPAGVGR